MDQLRSVVTTVLLQESSKDNQQQTEADLEVDKEWPFDSRDFALRLVNLRLMHCSSKFYDTPQ
jgi:hypothetical protein